MEFEVKERKVYKKSPKSPKNIKKGKNSFHYFLMYFHFFLDMCLSSAKILKFKQKNIKTPKLSKAP